MRILGFNREVFDPDKVTDFAKNLQRSMQENWNLEVVVDEFVFYSEWNRNREWLADCVYLQAFHKVFPGMWSRNADTSPCEEKWSGRECDSNHRDLKM